MFFKGLFRKKRPGLPDNWAVCNIGTERRTFLRINTPLKQRVHQAGFTVSTVFTVPMHELNGEADVSSAFEEALFEQLQDTGFGIVAAVLTRDGTRDFITYTPNDAVGLKIQASLSAKFPAVTVTVSSKEDVHWELFQSLLPGA